MTPLKANIDFNWLSAFDTVQLPGTANPRSSTGAAIPLDRDESLSGAIQGERPRSRKWATERKHLPDVDVAQAGGWESLEALKKSYQHADPVTMLSVVLGGGELREAKQG